MTSVGHDQRPLTEAQLGSVTRSDPDTLDKSQHLDQPVHRRGNIRIGKLGDHRTKRGRAIRSHHWKDMPRQIIPSAQIKGTVSANALPRECGPVLSRQDDCAVRTAAMPKTVVGSSR